MSVVSLIMWIVTALAGLFLLAIWLIEYDPDFQTAAATRLPLPVISGHVLLAVGGLAVWIIYLVTDSELLAWITLGDLAIVLCLGVTMAVRWIGVYQSRALPARPTSPASRIRAGAGTRSGSVFQVAERGTPEWKGTSAELAVPPERHFPVSVVVGHGIFAVTTIVLVLLTTLNGATS